MHDLFRAKVGGEGWFGGGADLTPYYLEDADITGFHRFYKSICDRYDPQVSGERHSSLSCCSCHNLEMSAYQ